MLRAALRKAEEDRQSLQIALERAILERDLVLQSRLWRSAAPLRSGFNWIRRLLVSGVSALPSSAHRFLRVAYRIAPMLRRGTVNDVKHYTRWIATCDTINEDDRDLIRRHIARLASRPLISVIMPVHETPEPILQETIRSVRAQLYPDWELCIADDASPSMHVTRVLEAAAAEDPRIRWVRREYNGNISAATNTALSLARGEYVALLDHDDCLAESALYEVAALLNEHPDTDIAFSDEDRFEGDGASRKRHSPYFKPAWDPDLVLGHNSVCHLGVYRRSLIERIGGLREGFEGSQDWDLILRASAATEASRIRHIPAVLYGWRLRQGESFSETQLARCVDAARRATIEHLRRLPGGEGAEVLPHPRHPSYQRIRWPLPDPRPRVSVIVPTRDRSNLLERCAEGVLRRTDYPDIELIVVDNGSCEPATLALFDRLREDQRVRILPAPGPFNYSALNNRAAQQASGEILVLLNNDIEVLEGSWLREMVSHAVRPDVGSVGARLLYADRSVQHAGVVLGVGEFDGGPGVASHFGWHEAPHEPGYFFHSLLTRTVCANTGACLAVRRATYEAVGGLDEVNLPVAFNDVDFCLRLREAGWRNVWTPFAELLHLESLSRGAEDTPEKQARAHQEIRYMRNRWGALLDTDPYYNENFSRRDQCYRLAVPGRRVRPWLRTFPPVR